MSTLLLALTVFAATGVDMVEALTIVLAVGVSRGWRSALQGAGAATAALVLVVAIFGTALATQVPLQLLHLLIGLALLVVGLHWLRKAVARAAGLRAHRRIVTLINLAGYSRGRRFLFPSSRHTVPTESFALCMAPTATLTSAEMVATRDLLKARLHGQQGSNLTTIERLGADCFRVTIPTSADKTSVIAALIKPASVVLADSGRESIAPGTRVILRCSAQDAGCLSHTEIGPTDLRTYASPRLQVVVPPEAIDYGNAQVIQDANGSLSITYSLDSAGARQWCNYTRRHVNGFSAIVLDGVVVTDTHLPAPICGTESLAIDVNNAVDAARIAAALDFGSYPRGLRLFRVVSNPETAFPEAVWLRQQDAPAGYTFQGIHPITRKDLAALAHAQPTAFPLRPGINGYVTAFIDRRSATALGDGVLQFHSAADARQWYRLVTASTRSGSNVSGRLKALPMGRVGDQGTVVAVVSQQPNGSYTNIIVAFRRKAFFGYVFALGKAATATPKQVFALARVVDARFLQASAARATIQG